MHHFDDSDPIPSSPNSRSDIEDMLPFSSRSAMHAPHHWLTVVAWCAIVLATVGIFVMQNAATAGEDPPPIGPDPIGDLVLGIQGKLFVKLADLTAADPNAAAELAAELDAIDLGTVTQRMRVAVLSLVLESPADAAERLDVLGTLIDEHNRTNAGRPAAFPEVVFTPRLTAAWDTLRTIIDLHVRAAEQDAPVTESDVLAATDADGRAALADELGWFGRLAIVDGRPPADPEHEAVMADATRTFTVIMADFGFIVLAGLAGFVGLVMFIIFAATRQLRFRVNETIVARHGVYAETFAIWLILFFVIQAAVGFLPGPSLLWAAFGFFASLIALAWPVARGLPWSQVRADIGWTAPQAPLEVFAGLGGYAMALPVLALGLLGAILLMLLQGGLGGMDLNPFAPLGGPAHPIIAEVASGNLVAQLQILLVGSVAAPIVEETMFRGVLYRHLREGTRGASAVASFILAALINGVIFAAIHPQGWVAIPALASLAFMFSLAREWRGSLIAPMVMHAVSNGIVLGSLCLLAA